ATPADPFAVPPATRTWPLPSSVAVGRLRAVIVPADDHLLVVGSKSSAVPMLAPPTARTLPLPSGVRVCSCRATLIGATADQVLVAGSYTSAVLVGATGMPAL